MEYTFSSLEHNRFPSMVQISITNVCDMSCNMCPHASYALMSDFRPKHINYDLFRKIAEEVGRQHKEIRENVGEHTFSVRLLGWGEALLHPQITDMVKYAKDAGVEYVTLITNGLKLDQERARGLLEGGLDILEVSLDAYSEETYKKVRRNPYFQRIKQNILQYLQMREDLGCDSYIAVGIIDQPIVRDEIEKFRQFWSQHADKVVIRRFRDFKGHVKDPIEIPKTIEPCRCLWARFNITPEGKVTICYDDWQHKFIIGDLNEEGSTIEGIWHSPGIEKERKAHLEGKTYSDVCAQCITDRFASSWKEPYESLLKEVGQWKAKRVKEREGRK